MASIDRRVSKATGQVTYQVRYRTPEGAPRAKSFRLKREADRFARDVEVAKDAGGFVDPQRSSVTVAEWVNTWLASKANLKPSSRERNASIIREHIEPRWSRTKLADLRHEAVQEWLNSIKRSPATVRKAHRVLSQALDYAVKAHRLNRNPAKGVSLPRVQHAEKRYLTHGEVDQLAELVGSEWRLLVLLLAYTGLRWGELAALKVCRLDLLRRRLIIAESVTPVSGVMTWGDVKNHERREVPIPKFLVADLEKQIEGKGSDSLLFTGPRGGVLRSQTFQRAALNAAAEKLEICEPKLDAAGRTVTRRVKDADGRLVDVPVFTKHLHPHELRHTAASLAIASGADVKVVQQMLGHKSATMTLDLYGHLFPDRLDVVADAMDQARKAALKLA